MEEKAFVWKVLCLEMDLEASGKLSSSANPNPQLKEQCPENYDKQILHITSPRQRRKNAPARSLKIFLKQSMGFQSTL